MAKFTTVGGTTYDYTDALSNPDAREDVTPREGGFTCWNYINWDGAGLATDATAVNGVANTFKLLKIPARSIVRRLGISKKYGETSVTHQFHKSSASASASDGSGALLAVGILAYKSASLASTVADVDALADHALTKKTGAAAAGAFGTVSASTPWTSVNSQSDTSAPTLPFAFPYGGFITMNIVNSTGSSASSLDARMNGDMMVYAVCDYMPM